MTVPKGELFLRLGGIGSGKTTLLKRYQRTTGADLLDETLWFSVDFLKAPLDPIEMEPFVWKSILNDIRARYKDKDYEKRRHLREIFQVRYRCPERRPSSWT